MYDNRAYEGAFIFADNNPQGETFIYNSDIYNNYAVMSLCNFIFTKFNIGQTNFYDNTARWVNNGITMISSDGQIDEIYV